MQDLAVLRMKTLEQIIKDKVELVLQLENDLKKEKHDSEKLEKGLFDRQTVLESYETRFIQVRSIIEKKDEELNQAHREILTLKKTIRDTDHNLSIV